MNNSLGAMFRRDTDAYAATLSHASLSLQKCLWKAQIYAVAQHVSSKINASLNENSDFDDAVAQVIEAWFLESIPFRADLAWVLKDLDYFQEIGLRWDEQLSLSGKACGIRSGDLVDALKDSMEGYSDAQDAITEELVEDFYVEWRSNFLLRVAQAARD